VDEKVDELLRDVDPRRAFLKKLIVGTAFAVPMVASYSVKDLAFAQGSIITTTE
jgi:hypothetical protein